MSSSEAEILRERAVAFLKNAIHLINNQVYDLAMFNIEQYCQLMLKYKILKFKGYYPKTHSLRRLIKELGDISEEILVLVKDTKYLHYIARIEEAYITARYLPFKYEADEVMDIYNFVDKVFKRYVERI